MIAFLISMPKFKILVHGLLRNVGKCNKCNTHLRQQSSQFEKTLEKLEDKMQTKHISSIC